MSAHGEQAQNMTPVRHWFRRFKSLIAIVFIVLFVPIFASEAFEGIYHYFMKLPKGVEGPSLNEWMGTQQKDQLAKLKQVSSFGLFGVYERSLDTEECDWFLQCHMIPPPSVAPASIPVVVSKFTPSLEAIEEADQMLKQRSTQSPAQTFSRKSIPAPGSQPTPGSIGYPADDAARIQANLLAHPIDPSVGLTPKTAVLPTQTPDTSWLANLHTHELPGTNHPDSTSLDPGGVNQTYLGGLRPIPHTSTAVPLTRAIDQPAVPRQVLPPQPLPPSLKIGIPVHVQQPTNPDNQPEDPQLRFFEHFYHFGPILVPTAATIRGTPHGLFKMAAAIWKAGWRAITLYLSCAVIYWFLMIAVANSQESTKNLFVYTMLILSPFCISMMVGLVQRVAMGLLHSVGWVLSLSAIVLTHAAALSLMVGARHIMKTPKELYEEVKNLA